MKKSNLASSYSNDHLPYDVLVKIFMVLNVVDLGIVSLVCKSWKSASSDRALWHKVDLSRLSSRFFYIPSKLSSWSACDKHSTSTKMAQFLKHALSLSGGNISCLIFNFYIPLTDIQFITAAQRTPNLKRLVLPFKGDLTNNGIHTAMASWRGLESMTITSMINCHHLFSAIHKWCKNIVELKFTCDFNQYHADALIKCTPNLKSLSVRTIMVEKRALEDVLDGLKHLKVVNICHSFIWGRIGDNNQIGFFSMSHLKKNTNGLIMICLLKAWCLRCKRLKNGRDKNPSRSTYGFFLEELWREDEIDSLAH